MQYISNLFDNYAGYFEQHVTQTLHYQVPNLLRDLVVQHSPSIHFKTLDLSCGTGLAGACFKNLAQRLVGVDLSSKMIEKAREKAIYDELLISDITAITPQLSEQFNLILAADVLVYCGDLAAIFQTCQQLLESGGYVSFSVEHSDSYSYQLTESARFAHHPDYIQQTLTAHQFTVIEQQLATTRLQANQPVTGTLWLAQKI